MGEKSKAKQEGKQNWGNRGRNLLIHFFSQAFIQHMLSTYNAWALQRKKEQHKAQPGCCKRFFELLCSLL